MEGGGSKKATVDVVDGPFALPLSTGVYVCDLVHGLTENELRQVFGQYGEIISFQQADASPNDAVLIEYRTCQAAEEAQRIVHLASIRGKTCRCLLVSALEVIRRTMVAGNRLIVENIDPAIETHGFWNVCGLFGQLLDCKLQLHPDGRSCGLGFAHYARQDEAMRAKAVLDKMQIGDSEVKLRLFQWDDAALFTGSLYARLIYNPYSDASEVST